MELNKDIMRKKTCPTRGCSTTNTNVAVENESSHVLVLWSLCINRSPHRLLYLFEELQPCMHHCQFRGGMPYRFNEIVQAGKCTLPQSLFNHKDEPVRVCLCFTVVTVIFSCLSLSRTVTRQNREHVFVLVGCDERRSF